MESVSSTALEDEMEAVKKIGQRSRHPWAMYCTEITGNGWSFKARSARFYGKVQNDANLETLHCQLEEGHCDF